jgi:hypothetical protein
VSMQEGLPAPVSEHRVLRLFRFRPVRKGFDAILRDELIPDLFAFPGLIDVYVGRHGPDEMGERLVASVWESRGAMTGAVGDTFDQPVFHPEHLGETTERELEIHGLDVALRFDEGQGAASPATGILRLVRGQVRPGELEGYRDEVRLGTVADADAGHGPIALYMATEAPDRFVSLSAWSDWSALETATGGDTDHPIATRHAERILRWDAVHYEVLPNMAHPTAAGAR